MDIRDFLFRKFIEWQSESGARRTQKQFAEYIGVSAASLSDWMNGVYLPSGFKNLTKLSAKLGMEIYDILEIPRSETVSLSPVKRKLFNWINNLSETEAEKRVKEIEAAQQTNPVLSGKPKKAK